MLFLPNISLLPLYSQNQSLWSYTVKTYLFTFINLFNPNPPFFWFNFLLRHIHQQSLCLKVYFATTPLLRNSLVGYRTLSDKLFFLSTLKILLHSLRLLLLCLLQSAIPLTAVIFFSTVNFKVFFLILVFCNLCYACIHALLLQLYLTLYDPMDCILPDSSVRGIILARRWSELLLPLSGDFSDPGLNLCLLCLLFCRQFLCHWAVREAPMHYVYIYMYTYTFTYT